MKWIKTYEAKRRIVPPDTSKVATDYKNYCDDLDEFSAITFDEFVNSLDFDIFSKHSSEFYDAGVRSPKIEDGITVHKIGSYSIWNSEYIENCPNGLQKNIDWFRRNTFIYAEVNTGGASGGSCWDDENSPGAQEYYGKELDLRKFIYDYFQPKLEIILSRLPNMKSAKEMCDILFDNIHGIVRSSHRTDYEYYGNYDNYSCYYITLERLFKFIGDNDGF